MNYIVYDTINCYSQTCALIGLMLKDKTVYRDPSKPYDTGPVSKHDDWIPLLPHNDKR